MAAPTASSLASANVHWNWRLSVIDFNYRPEVDGLRAVAVMLVLLFHAGLGFSGGYVGVDVFFVISGFLITGLVLKEQREGTFRLSNFWARRIRRILPASTFVVLITLFAGAMLMLPSDYVELAKSAFAQQLMVSNIFFWRTSGYFGGASDLKPLLHTWSLAVEEQFYLGYPFLLAYMVRFPAKTLFRLLTALTILSLILSEFGVRKYPSATFYLLPTRAWEMALGGLLCFGDAKTWLKGWKANAVSLCGLVAILVTGCVFDSTTRFPGLSAAIPCVGAACIIFSNSSGLTWTGRLLATKPFVTVGLLSYSLYLWHWPLLAFARYRVGEDLPPAIGIGALCASFALAYLSWKFVETPFRKGTRSARPQLAYVAAVASILVMASFSACLIATEGAQFRFSKDVLVFDQRGRGQVNPEFEGTVKAAKTGNLPAIGAAPGEKDRLDFLIWGDSHARVVAPLCNQLAQEHGLHGVVASKSGVGPMVGYGANQSDGVAWNDAVFQFIADHNVSNVILIANWASIFPDEHADKLPMPLNERTSSLSKTVTQLTAQGLQVWILEQVPEQSQDPNLALWTAASLGQKLPGGISLPQHREKQALANALIDSLASEKVRVVNPIPDFFDDNGQSLIGDSGGSYYWDKDHLSAYGTDKFLREVLNPIFASISRDQQLEPQVGLMPAANR